MLCARCRLSYLYNSSATFQTAAAPARLRRSLLRQLRRYASAQPAHATASNAASPAIDVPTDEWLNIPPSILQALPKKLHLRPDHPLSITRQLIESRFPTYKYHNSLSPIVTASQNFDSLGVPPDHISRARSDTYYFNKDTLLRTHTSAHQVDTFRSNQSDGFLIAADVYRRDAVDRSHYPIFHQMEGAHTWDRAALSPTDLISNIKAAISAIPAHNIDVEDPNPTIHPERNPLQPDHTVEQVEAISNHLKRSLENVVVEIFDKARQAAIASNHISASTAEPLRVRWVEAYFPFVSPGWELEVFWQGDWLEVLGSGVVKQQVLDNAGVSDRIGWAFGLGLERIAMLLFDIPDIRLFWSQDLRFLSQFAEGRPIKRFAPFSRYPECYKDVSFWLPPAPVSNSTAAFHENDVMEIVRTVAGDVVEDVRFVDQFTHPKTKRESMCYRINYRSLERTLRNDEVNHLHESICNQMVQQLGVEIR